MFAVMRTPSASAAQSPSAAATVSGAASDILHDFPLPLEQLLCIALHTIVVVLNKE
jgi:hypothetical protein